MPHSNLQPIEQKLVTSASDELKPVRPKDSLVIYDHLSIN